MTSPRNCVCATLFTRGPTRDDGTAERWSAAKWLWLAGRAAGLATTWQCLWPTQRAVFAATALHAHPLSAATPLHFLDGALLFAVMLSAAQCSNPIKKSRDSVELLLVLWSVFFSHDTTVPVSKTTWVRRVP
jgi:hypothetical protein